MQSAADRPGVRRVNVLDSVLIVVLVGLIVLTAAALAIPGLAVTGIAVGLDLFLDTVSALVTIAVSALMWVRYRERGDPTALVQAAAFLVLAIANSIAVVIAVTTVDTGTAIAGLLPGQAPLYLAAVARLLASSLLVVGLWAALRGATTGHPWATLAAPVVGLLAVIVLVNLFGPNLPPLSSEPIPAGPRNAASIAGSTPLGWFVGCSSAALFLLASIQARRLYRRAGSIGDAYLSVGLVLGGFSQLFLALAPGIDQRMDSGGDLLRVGFDVALLLGIEAEARATLASLRTANQTLVRLKDAEADRSTLQERVRLGRELHDGLSQDLWLAKLKVGRLAALPMLGSEAVELAEELDDVIDAGLADARQAVIALRWTGDLDTSFCEQLARYVDDFGDRSGLRAEFTCEQEVPRLLPRAEAELLRIAQEALNNVRRHADATVVRVHAAVAGGSLRLGVVDNGRGFDPEVVGDSAYGLASMQERAALIGGRLSVDSRPLDGTSVWVDVPLADAVAPGAPVAS